MVEIERENGSIEEGNNTRQTDIHITRHSLSICSNYGNKDNEIP